MSYVVLARKWRPQQFADVLGQEHVTQTLTNAIGADRIAHAFLFSGPRGVGKTSAARILSKALCCLSSDGPTPTPCGECAQCVEITEGRSTDVFEIDAASHTGVDNVREIIDNVRYLPSSARFKIYVIDEVHMLSTGAFNALLKTLEEPPPHVKFVLATTDVHKVPVTILSRCQRYDFRRIPFARIADRLSFILKEEDIPHEPSALTLVAREAEGSMRDAQSLVEQVLAFAAGRTLDPALVREALGVVDSAQIERTFDAIAARRPADLLEVVGEVHQRGLDLKRFGDALVEHARDLLVAKLVADPKSSLDRPKDEIEKLVEQAGALGAKEIERLFEQLCRIVEDVGRSPHPRFALEVGLASLADEPPAVSLESVLAQLSRLEAALAGKPSRPSGPKGPPSGGSGRPERSRREAGPRSPPPARAAPEDAPRPPPPARAAPEDAPRPPPPARAAPEDAPGPPPAAEAGPQDFSAFVELVKERRPPLAATLLQVRPLAFGPEAVNLGCETAFDEKKLQDRDTQSYLEELLESFFGAKPALRITRGKRSGGAVAPDERTLQEVDDERRRKRVSEKEQAAREAPAVKAISDKLGAEIADIRVIDEERRG